MKSSVYLAAVLCLMSTSVLAAQKTVILNVPGMTCAACPITVKKALSKVEGVQKTEVDYAMRQASVTFDDGKADVARLIRATTDAGYPASVKGEAR